MCEALAKAGCARGGGGGGGRWTVRLEASGDGLLTVSLELLITRCSVILLPGLAQQLPPTLYLAALSHPSDIGRC